jgi:hypothetical protein
MMRLMQKNGKDQGVVGVNDLERWPIDSAAVEFSDCFGVQSI